MRRTGSLAAILVAALISACSSDPTLLDDQESYFGIKENLVGSNHRAFHKILHYPHGTGLRIPGYIVGVEKANREHVDGPAKGSALLEQANNDERKRLIQQSKIHLITHVMRYEPAKGDDVIFPGRLQPCALYSLLEPDGGRKEQLNTSSQEPLGRQLFSLCPGIGEARGTAKTCDPADSRPSEHCKPGAFESSWEGIAALRKDLGKSIADDGYTHILVVVMGWNTTQDNAVDNYNSILGHLLDEVESRRKMRSVCNNGAHCPRNKNELQKTHPANNFKPLVVGVTWASEWAISELSPVSPQFVRLLSFPNKANDAEELGITWLNAILHQAILPARAASGKQPRVIILGHSFGARASFLALSQDGALCKPQTECNSQEERQETWEESSKADKETFADGDLFIALQGAFAIEELYPDDKQDTAIGGSRNRQSAIQSKNLRTVLTATKHDSANDTAFWKSYAGSIKAYQKVCKLGEYPGVRCTRIPPWNEQTDPTINFGFQLCAKSDGVSLPTKPTSNENSKVDEVLFDSRAVDTWADDANSNLLYVDATALMTCRAAFTGGGSHSDIYRRETARFLWELIR